MFLKSQAGRGIFQIFVGLLVFNASYPGDIAISIYLALAGIFNLVIAWVLPAVAHFKFLKDDLKGSGSEQSDASNSGNAANTGQGHYINYNAESSSLSEKEANETTEMLDRDESF
jgi:hypothetical protein